MDEQDRSNLRDLHAGFALIGLLLKDGSFLDMQHLPTQAYELADMMQEARNLHGAGIVSVKRRTKKEKSDE
jgi:hypothetical protein